MSLSYIHSNKHMHKLWYHVIFVMLCCLVLKTLQQDIKCSEDATIESCLNPVFTIITLKKRDNNLVKSIANAHGMYVKGQPFFEASYFLEPNDKEYYKIKRSSIYESIKKHPEVVSIKSDYARERAKRGHIYQKDLIPILNPKYKHTRNDGKSKDNNLLKTSPQFNDPLYKKQWYLNGINNTGYDMNVREAWSMGYSGKGVTVAVVDNGVEHTHPDLKKNYDPMASIDISEGDNDPSPRNYQDDHGTRCAGIISASANNSKCGVGIAFNSKLGAIKLTDEELGDVTDGVAFSFKNNYIDIYSSSWGPVDNGKVFGGFGPIGNESLYKATKYGRNGKGNIFVWAGGNGAIKGDSCSADSYITSIYTLAVSSVTYSNKKPYYTEKCPAIIASTYSSGNENEPKITSTDLLSDCVETFGQTSASAPMASGIIALALEANPLLTWRDVQHITIRTANPTPLLNNTGWRINGVDRLISDSFGYGLMDAGAFVKSAKIWKTVPEQNLCRYKYKMPESQPKSVKGKFKINFTLDANDCTDGKPVHYLEHVQVISTITYSKRGDLKLTLYSPKGTESVMLPTRENDYSSNAIEEWPFLTVQMWGEDPRGIWTLTVESITNDENTNGTIHDWELLLYGTEEPAQPTDPKHISETFASYEYIKYQIFYHSAYQKLLELFNILKKFLGYDS